MIRNLYAKTSNDRGFWSIASHRSAINNLVDQYKKMLIEINIHANTG